jgi:hypothetical protein
MDSNDAPHDWSEYAIKIESRINFLTKLWLFLICQYAMDDGNLPANPMIA